MDMWGTSSFVEATIGLNLASGYWKPLVETIKRLPKYYEEILNDKILSLSAQFERENGGDDVRIDLTNNTLQKCQRVLKAYKAGVGYLWSSTEFLIWTTVLLGMATLYFGCEDWRIAILLIPVFLFIFLSFLIALWSLLKLWNIRRKGNIALKELTESEERKEMVKFAKEVESKSESDSKEGLDNSSTE